MNCCSKKAGSSRIHLCNRIKQIQSTRSQLVFKISINIVKVENVRMTFVLNSRMMLHPLRPREGRTTIKSRSTHDPHTHILLMQGSRSDFAINGAKVTRLLFKQIITRSNSLHISIKRISNMLRVTFRQRIVLIVILSHNFLEIFNRLHLLLIITISHSPLTASLLKILCLLQL